MEEKQPMQWFVFCGDKLLLQKKGTEGGGKLSVPFGTEPPVKLEADTCVHTVHDSYKSYTTYTTYKTYKSYKESPPIGGIEGGYEWLGLRASFNVLPLEDYRAAGKAYQILYWDEHSRFCPVCGTEMGEPITPIMKRCPKCGNEMYPPVSTAIIVLIRRGEEVLLVHARNFRGTFYGLVAGFLEAGETLEECVQREVMEETGLSVKNIRYFDSQPWPFPSGLMVGFIADYAGGEIKLQDEELSAGAFYTRDNLPEIPQKMSIARRLIDWWRDNP